MAEGQQDKDRFDQEAQLQSTAAARQDMSPDKKARIMEGWAVLVKGDAQAALDHFQAALSADSGSVEAQYGVAASLKALGRHAEAIQAYQDTLAKISSIDTAIERVRVTMLKHLAESALRDLEAGGGKPAAYEPPK